MNGISIDIKSNLKVLFATTFRSWYKNNTQIGFSQNIKMLHILKENIRTEKIEENLIIQNFVFIWAKAHHYLKIYPRPEGRGNLLITNFY
jgi:hypothetical protein